MPGRLSVMSQHGLSLVETMIALMVLVVGLSGVYHFFPQGLNTSRHALERTQATFLARAKLEQLRAQGFAALTAAQAPSPTPAPFVDAHQQPVAPRFRWQAEIKPAAAELLEVHVRVSWPWPRQRYQVRLATYVSKR